MNIAINEDHMKRDLAHFMLWSEQSIFDGLTVKQLREIWTAAWKNGCEDGYRNGLEAGKVSASETVYRETDTPEPRIHPLTDRPVKANSR